MAIAKKLSGYLSKKVKEAPKSVEKGDPRMDKADVKEMAQSINMTRLSNAELDAIAEKAGYTYSSKGRETRSDAALEELNRRGLKKYLKKEGKLSDDTENPVYDTATGARMSDALSSSDLRKEVERRSKEAKEKGYNKGGMVTKKKAPAKAKAPATKSRSNALNKFYGK